MTIVKEEEGEVEGRKGKKKGKEEKDSIVIFIDNQNLLY